MCCNDKACRPNEYYIEHRVNYTSTEGKINGRRNCLIPSIKSFRFNHSNMTSNGGAPKQPTNIINELERSEKSPGNLN